MNTKIEYCDDTVNFVTGCFHSCRYCFARRMSRRLGGIAGTVYYRLKQEGYDPFEPAFHWDVLSKVRDRLSRSKKSRRVFISSMGDIGCKTYFHSTSEGYRLFDHDGNKITKRVLKSNMTTGDVLQEIYELCTEYSRHKFLLLSKNPKMFRSFVWPDNVCVGTSVDSMSDVTVSRMRDLGDVVAATRWISVEPLLDPSFDAECLGVGRTRPRWVVIGGLSGKKPLPRGCDRAAERIILWCRHHDIPVFCKDNLPRLNGEMPKEYP